MSDVIARAREWIKGDPDPATRAELQHLIDDGDTAELHQRMDTALSFGTAGIRGEVGAGPAHMNRAVVIRTTYGLARHLRNGPGPVVIGFDARPDSRTFAEDAAGVLTAAGFEVRYFPDSAPTPLVAYAAKVLSAQAGIVITASHNPPADNGYKVYGSYASQIVSPVDTQIQERIADAPKAVDIPRDEKAFSGDSSLASPVGEDVVDSYWAEVSATRSRHKGSDLEIVYTPIHGVGRDLLLDVMSRAGHTNVVAVPEQAEPDGSFPTVDFPNPEEPGALDLALAHAERQGADLVIANDPDADRLAAVVRHDETWRPLTGNEIGVLLGDYLLANCADPASAIVANSIVSTPMMGSIADKYDATHTTTLTGFKWIVSAGRALEEEGLGRFLFGFEEALGYTVGPTVRDKDGISAALMFADLAADLDDAGSTILTRLAELWKRHGLWVSGQVSVVRTGPEGSTAIRDAVSRLAASPPEIIGGYTVTNVVDYRRGATERPAWLGAQALVEMALGRSGRVLVRPSGTEPKLKIYVDLAGELRGDAEARRDQLMNEVQSLGAEVKDLLVL